MSTKNNRVIGVIPARYSSSRLPGKVLADIAGMPMIQRVYERAGRSKILDELFVAVDDHRVKKCVENFGGRAIMTAGVHQSGTDRIAEAVEKLDAGIIVNIQGDQPLLDPVIIDEAVKPLLKNPDIPMSTIKTEIGEDAYNDPGVVKVVVDDRGFALYFSRSLIPFPRYQEGLKIYEHVGLYVYRKEFLLRFSKWPQGYLEKIESLEQLRVLEKGYKILVVETKSDRSAGVSVDTPEDLARVVTLLKSSKN